MPERENAVPPHDPSARLGDLFENLPAPAARAQTPSATSADSAAPGSRRAAREAVKDTAAIDVASAGGEAEDSAVEPVAPSDSVRTSTVAPSAPGLDDLFETSSHDPGDPHTQRKKRRKGCLVALIVVLLLVGGLAAGGVWVWNTYGEKISDTMGWGEPKDWEDGVATGETTITISSGDTGSPVSTALFKAGVTKTDRAFYDMLIKEGEAVTFYPGVYKLQKKMSAASALLALQDKANKMENAVGIAEGGTVASSLPRITEVLGIPLAELETAVADPSVYGVMASTLEGWLFPAVYTFDPGVSAQQVIQRMVDRTRESLSQAGVPDDDAQRVLTIASIIQREGRTADFAKVSRVIQNRLDDGMKLQMDSTAQYGYGSLHEGVVSSSKEALNNDNAWNTYVHTGLPAGPIANPGDAAIAAAMHPEDGPWFYFVTINLATGETQFSTTYEEHQQGIKKWHTWCRENPNQGC